ncbi:hypothetical protein D4764_18G0006960 [Takifugu flavidus]|uniref:Uncharacterized protein n=1 Tax=Takifugu flavidus TaxID=433684 RepID=A0A5C6NUX3_9TELE|nr:hypothetical protein D4764_18G0006960 [Takifugu flavidus]
MLRTYLSAPLSCFKDLKRETEVRRDFAHTRNKLVLTEKLPGTSVDAFPNGLMEHKQPPISTKVNQQQHNSAQHFQDLLFGPTYGSDLRGAKSALRA